MAMVLIMVVSELSLQAQDETCGRLLDSGTAFALRFLREQNAARTSPCISEVIMTLGRARIKSAVPELVLYLDYKDPKTGAGPDGGGTTMPIYPAAEALFDIGKPATQEVMQAIEAAGSMVARRNAITAFHNIYRDDLVDGIRLLRKQAESCTTTSGRNGLATGISRLLEDCLSRGGQGAAACRAAAQTL